MLKGSFQIVFVSVPAPVVSLNCPTPPQETLQHWQVVLLQFPMGSLLLSSGSWCTQNFVCALQDWSLCFPQSCGSHAIKSCWLQSQILWKFLFLLDSKTEKTDVGLRSFTRVGTLLLYYCSPVCGSLTWWEWDLSLSWLCSSTTLLKLLYLSMQFLYFIYLFIYLSFSILLWMVVQ